MPEAQTLVLVGGVFNLAFAVFHLFFWHIFGWKNELAKLSFINRAIVQVLNLCLTFALVMFSYLSLVYSQDLIATALGRSLLLSVTIFWLLRAIYQAVFFKLRHWASWMFLAAFLGGSTLYAAALIIVP